MPFSVYFRYAVCLVFLGIVSTIGAQNLVDNYSFEVLTNCPEGYGAAGPSIAPPWEAPSFGTPDIFNTCATNPLVGVPENFFGYQEPLTGAGYAGIHSYNTAYEYREYLSAELLQPLIAGTWYNVSFYVNRGDEGCSIVEIGAHFTYGIQYLYEVGAYDFIPEVESNQGLLSDSFGWTLITGCILAKGGENFITIGNFRSDENTTSDPNCSLVWSYYYVEDVSVIAAIDNEEIPLELGDPVTACPPYVIDPDLSGYIYTWSDGSHDPTLEVTTSGVYALTITDEECNFGIDSVEITISGSIDPIDLGPPLLTLCEGEDHIITLDPSLSEYTWQDGSHTSTYTISTAGTYSVTLDDGCTTASDEIEILYIQPPSQDILGEDMSMCSQDIVVISLDPTLGDYIWQDGSTSSTYSINTGGTYSVTVSNICGTESDEIIITEILSPAIDFGIDEVMICEGASFDIEFNPDLGDFLWQDGSMSPSYEITSPGLYSVTVSNECGSSSDDILITLTPTPFVDLGEDMMLCEGESIVLLANATNGNHTWQDNSTADTFLVVSSGFYSLTTENECGISTDEISIDYIPNVLAPDLGPDINLCPGEEVILFANAPGPEFLWQDFSTENYFVATNPGTYYVEVYNECMSLTDTIVVSSNNTSPQVDLPDQLLLCQGESLTLEANITGVDYLWNDNSQAQQLVVNTSGIYSVTVTNACGTDQDTVIVIDGGLPPEVLLGNDFGLCPGEVITLTPQFLNTTTWQWQDGTTTPEYAVSNPGMISIQANNSCGAAFDTLLVSMLPDISPLELGPDTSLCSWQSVTISIPISNVDIVWQDGSTQPDFTIQNMGIVHATITNSCGQSSDTILVNGLPDVPFLNLGMDQSLCPGETIILSPGIMNVDYLWQDGSVAPTYTTTLPASIILTISNSCGTSIDTLEIITNTQGPQLDLGEDIQGCDGESIMISSGISGVNYLWQDGSIGPAYVTTVSGMYILQVSNNCGSDTDTILVDISGISPMIHLGEDIQSCEGELVVISSGITDVDYLWQDGSTDPVYTATQSGVYILQVSNHCGSDTDTLLVDISGLNPILNLGPDLQVCDGNSVTILSGITGVNYLWQDGAISPEYTTTQSGEFILQVSNHCGTDTDTIIVDISGVPPTPALGPDTSLCEGLSLIFVSTADAETTIEWQDGSSAPSYPVNTSGTFILSETNHCGEAADTIMVTFLDAPDAFSFGPDTILCPGEFLTLYAPSTDYELLWQDGSGDPMIIADQAITYSLQLSNNCGIVSDEIEISFDTAIPQFDFDPSIIWCEGDVVMVDATQPFLAEYLWNYGATSPMIAISEPGVYTIEVTTLCNTASQQIEIIEGLDCKTEETKNDFYIPNVFSPNADGINDLFFVSVGPDLDIQSMEGRIFDRWGNLIYGSERTPFSWNGFFADELMMSGVYTYMISIAFKDELQKDRVRVFAGDVTLMR